MYRLGFSLLPLDSVTFTLLSFGLFVLVLGIRFLLVLDAFRICIERVQVVCILARGSLLDPVLSTCHSVFVKLSAVLSVNLAVN